LSNVSDQSAAAIDLPFGNNRIGGLIASACCGAEGAVGLVAVDFVKFYADASEFA